MLNNELALYFIIFYNKKSQIMTEFNDLLM